MNLQRAISTRSCDRATWTGHVTADDEQMGTVVFLLNTLSRKVERTEENPFSANFEETVDAKSDECRARSVNADKTCV